MPIEIFAVGGYSDVGKNMTAIKVDDEVVIFDMGLHLDNWIAYTQDEDIVEVSSAHLIKAGAVPDINSLPEDWKSKIKAIMPTHPHLDHIGAIPFLSNHFHCPIVCTPYTAEVLRAIVKDEEIKLKNRIIAIAPNSTYKVSENISVEFVHITHSTPHSVIGLLKTKHGNIIYANDFKLDHSPTLGKPVNMERLKELGDKGILALIVESLYTHEHRKTPSESVAKEMLKDVLLNADLEGKAVVVTTFSSHLARLKSIVEFGKKMKRRVVFLGRSLAKYSWAGENVGIVDFKSVEVIKYKGHVQKKLKHIARKGKHKYLLVMTGHQGEPKSVLSRITNGELHFKFDPDDVVIFSSRVIPTETNIENRRRLEDKLHAQKVRIFTDVHVSGHAAREDLREFIKTLKPEHVIPAHGNKEMFKNMHELLTHEMGYKDDQVLIMHDGKKVRL